VKSLTKMTRFESRRLLDKLENFLIRKLPRDAQFVLVLADANDSIRGHASNLECPYEVASLLGATADGIERAMAELN
jgi:hypothetical protein